MKIDTRRAIFEFLSIVIAVILAMTLTEARQNYLNKKEAEISYKNILEEIVSNREGLLRDSTNINADLRGIDSYIENIDAEEPDELSLGFTLSFLNAAALEVAKINESMGFLPNETNMQLSAVYKTQAFYEEKAKETFNVMADLNSVRSDMTSDVFISKLREYQFQLRLVSSAIHTYLEETESFAQELDSLNSL